MNEQKYILRGVKMSRNRIKQQLSEMIDDYNGTMNQTQQIFRARTTYESLNHILNHKGEMSYGLLNNAIKISNMVMGGKYILDTLEVNGFSNIDIIEYNGFAYHYYSDICHPVWTQINKDPNDAPEFSPRLLTQLQILKKQLNDQTTSEAFFIEH